MLVTVGMDCLDVRLKSTGVGGTKSEEGRPVRQRSYPRPIRRASTGSITTPLYVLVKFILLDPRAQVLMREVNLNVTDRWKTTQVWCDVVDSALRRSNMHLRP